MWSLEAGFGPATITLPSTPSVKSCPTQALLPTSGWISKALLAMSTDMSMQWI